jgi:mannonate dehydratase
MYALKKYGYKGLILDDHVPFINNDTRWGHTARANALGYLRGMQKVLEFFDK